ncbi:MAG: deaminase [Epsilonproteobacteria bacterium 4484_20]|nr:MAG: deaminase [Epsilonproteobacteria bacterium 4484_20]
MTTRIISTEDAPKAIGPYSQAIVANGLVYTSGQIALMPDGKMETRGVEQQTHQVIKNLFYVLAAAGAEFSDVIKTTIYLTDMNDFETMNKVYAHYFGNHQPARSTVAVKALPMGALVEIECIAFADRHVDFG